MRIKHVVKLIIFLLLFIGLFAWINKITEPNRIGYVPWEEYYSLPRDTLDVLILGSSKVNHTYNPVVIDQELNVDAYSLSSHGMGLAEMYPILKEAFKTQSPKIVAIELYSISVESVNMPDRARWHRAYEEMHFSLNKATAILSQVPLNESLEYFLPFEINHSEWKTLSLKKMLLLEGQPDFYTRYFGYYIIEYCMEKDKFVALPVDYLADKTQMEIPEDKMDIIKRINALCKDYNAELVFVVSPSVSAEKFGYVQMHQLVNGIRPYADSEGIEVFDYNTMLLDGELTYYDFTDAHHTSTLGADKVSKAFAGDLKHTFPALLSGCTGDWDISEEAEEYISILERLKDGLDK